MWAIEVGSFVVSASALALARPRATDAEVPRGIRYELAEGFHYVASVPFIWAGIVAACVILMFGMAPFNALLPRIVHSEFHRGVGSYGFLFSLMACGMVLGSLIWAHWAPFYCAQGPASRSFRRPWCRSAQLPRRAWPSSPS